jgi:peptidoglycan/xylan/chitin deacetylase (PgdA/CDA1 family)
MEHKIKVMRKTVFLVTILLLQAAFIYIYYTQEGFLSSLKWDYLKKVYLPVYRYELENKSFFHNTDGISQSRAASPGEKSIPVLLYHGVVEREDGSNISIDGFRDQMMALKKAGYQTVSLDDFHKFVEGEENLPDKAFLLTFDDGRKDSYYPVDPILKALDYNAVMFVITKYISEKNNSFYLSHQELQKMLDSGRWDLEAHTKEGHDMITVGPYDQKGHYYSNRSWDSKEGLESEKDFEERVFNDIVEVKNDLKNNFELEPVAFAYPFGDYGQNSINYPRSKEVILDIIHYAYPISFYQVSMGNSFLYNNFGENNNLSRRIKVAPEWTGDELIAVLKNGQAKDLPFEDDFTQINGWFSSDGLFEMDNNKILLKTLPGSGSANLLLDGTRHWEDFKFETQIDWNKSQKLSLFSHYKDFTNYLSCDVDNQYVQLVSVYEGKYELIGESPMINAISRNNLKISLEAQGNKLICSVGDNVKVEFSGIKNEQLSGGVGFRISNNEPGNGELTIKKVTVTDNSVPKQKSAEESLKAANQLGGENNVFYNNNHGIFQQTVTK